MVEPQLAPQRGDRRCATVVERIAGWAEVRPEATAVVDRERTVTYAELRERIEALAARLQQLDVRRDEPVAVHLERSADCVIAAAAAHAAGAAYLMLDPRQPGGWNHALFTGSGARVVLTRPELWEPVGAAAKTVDVAASGTRPPAVPLPTPDPGALAYVSYTSGSAGRPKAVLIEHAGLDNLVAWYLDHHGVRPEDRFTQLARQSFDAFALEVWPCLSGGAALHVVDSALLTSPGELRDWMCRTGITLSFLPTPLAEPLLELPWPRETALRDVLVGGDRLAAHPDPALPFRVHNNYGPTECSAVATCCEVTGTGTEQGPPPIGRPIPGVTAHVLGADGRELPDGEVGELHLGGIGLARGYLGDGGSGDGLSGDGGGPFRPDPFRDEPGARLYATGDLVRRDTDGRLHFLRRADEQVQIRAFRVEPSEVESALREHPAVARSVVLARGGAEPRLFAYVVPREAGLDAAVLREHLTRRLPDYMLPAGFVLLDELPLTPHGKVDREALAALPEPEPASGPATERDAAPAAELEAALAEVWAEVLGRTEIDPAASFFEIGGDSLRVVRLIGKCKRRGIELQPEDVYAHPGLRELATAIQRRQPDVSRTEEGSA